MRPNNLHNQISLLVKSSILLSFLESFEQLSQMLFSCNTFLFHEVDVPKKPLESECSIHNLSKFLFVVIRFGHVCCCGFV